MIMSKLKGKRVGLGVSCQDSPCLNPSHTFQCLPKVEWRAVNIGKVFSRFVVKCNIESDNSGKVWAFAEMQVEKDEGGMEVGPVN